MSNNPLLGLDFKAPEPEKTKWVERPRKRSGGYAVRTRASRVDRDEDGDTYVPRPALPVAPNIEVSEPPVLTLPQPIPPAYTVKKPSLLQRFLDWVLL